MANYIFYILVFLGFCLPTNNHFYLPIPGIQLQIRELAFLLLPIINFACSSKNQAYVKDKKLKKLIFLFVLIVLFTEFIAKGIVFNQNFMDAFKAFRIGLPLMSSLIILYNGIRADVKIVWNVFLYSLGISILISIVSIFIYLPINNDMEEGVRVLGMASGRLENANASFGVIGIYLLFNDKDKWFNKGKLVKYISYLSIISLLLAFNRTFLALLFLEFVYFSYKTFSFKNAVRIILIPILFVGIVAVAYTSNESIRYQIDNRFFSILSQKTSLKEATIEGNRDFIYDGISARINEGFWIIGLPLKTAIFEYYAVLKGTITAATVTDISPINILLRNGILSLCLFILILLRIWRIRFISGIVLLIYILVSFNSDALYSQNSILFLILFGLVYQSSLRKGMSKKQTEYKQFSFGNEKI